MDASLKEIPAACFLGLKIPDRCISKETSEETTAEQIYNMPHMTARISLKEGGIVHCL